MGAGADLDFATLLDELIAASGESTEDGEDFARPSLHVDLLAQIERLQAENVALFPDRALHEYGENAGPAATQADAAPQQAGQEASLQPALDDLFFLDPQTIARELGIEPKARVEDLDRARRAFALRYHPDRVPEAFRERAALRMQIANMLIDEAKRSRL